MRYEADPGMAMMSELVAGWERHLAALRGEYLAAGKSVHLVGIGGIGMAGIALHLHARGLQVTGSELAPSRVTEWLAGHGIPVCFGHAANQVTEATDWLIRTPAVPDHNPEIVQAHACGLTVVTRGVVLPVLLDGTRSVAVSGTHGKTTTASMIAQILHEAGEGPSHCIGGEIDRLGGVAAVGGGDILVVEADESDGTLVLYEPELGVLTNVEYDHMEHFDSEVAFMDCFRRFTDRCARLVYCADDPLARRLGQAVKESMGYGKGEGARVRYHDYLPDGACSRFVLSFPDGASAAVRLQAPGEHQVANAAGAAAAAWMVGLSLPAIVEGLQSFLPARRRFEVTVRRDDLVVISDYAHHPTEIRAVVKAARERHSGRLVAVYQPHRYTRTRALLNDFPDAFEGLDALVLAPVYAASEAPVPGGTSTELLAAIRAAGTVSACGVDSLEAAWDVLEEMCRAGDLVLILGAGDVERLAHREWPQRGQGDSP